jgi:N-acetyl-gamma-glutamyl-phosphate reductase
MPFSRGMESDCYVRMTSGTSVDDLRAALQEQYADETFVEVSCPESLSKLC